MNNSTHPPLHLRECPFCSTKMFSINSSPSKDGTVVFWSINHLVDSRCSVSMTDTDRDKLIQRWNARETNEPETKPLSKEDFEKVWYQKNQFSFNTTETPLSYPKPKPLYVADVIDKYFRNQDDEMAIWFDYRDNVKTNYSLMRKGIEYRKKRSKYEIYIVSETGESIIFNIIDEYEGQVLQDLIDVFTKC